MKPSVCLEAIFFCFLTAAVPGLAMAQTTAAAYTPTWELVKGPTGPNSAKPAEIIFDREDGTSSTVTNAALRLGAETIRSTAAVLPTTYGLTLGLAKNTLAKKRSELWSVGGNLRSKYSLSSGDKDDVTANLDALYEDDREHDAQGNAVLFDATLNSSRLHFDPDLGPGSGKKGIQARLYPSAGFYNRHVSTSSSPGDVPEGSHGGPYFALRLTTRLLWIDEDLTLFDRVSFEALFVQVWDRMVSGGYAKDNFQYGELSLNYLLYGQANGDGWKPSIGFTRSKGTNRVANEQRVDSLDYHIQSKPRHLTSRCGARCREVSNGQRL
jgi:hypothetical protein